jgi:hypothetical protein
MASRSSFSSLPAHLEQYVMNEAVQQLEQQHDFSSALLVDHAWSNIATSSCPKALQVDLSSCSTTNSFCDWLHLHGTALQSLTVHSQLPINKTSNPCRWRVFDLTSSISNLRKLDLSDLQLWDADADADISWALEATGFSGFGELQLRDKLTAETWTSLTSLTSLRLHACLDASAVTTITTLSQLQALDISGTRGAFDLQLLASSLQQLTFLDISGISSCASQLPCLLGLPKLNCIRFAGVSLPSCSLSKLGSLPLAAAEVTFQGREGAEQLSCWFKVAARRLQALQITHTCPEESHKQQQQQSEPCSQVQANSGQACSASGASACPVAAEGMGEHCAVFEALVHAKGLQDLAVIGCVMSPCLDLLTGLTQLTALVLNSCSLEDGAVCKLSVLQKLRSLSLAHNPEVLGEHGSMEVLAAGLPDLTRLVLICTGASGAAEQAWGARLISNCGGIAKLKQASAVEVGVEVEAAPSHAAL